MTAATFAFQSSSNSCPEQQQQQSQAKADWRSVATDFWDATAAESDRKEKVLYRTKVFEWIVATCNMLLIGCGSTWESWSAPNRILYVSVQILEQCYVFENLVFMRFQNQFLFLKSVPVIFRTLFVVLHVSAQILETNLVCEHFFFW